MTTKLCSEKWRSWSWSPQVTSSHSASTQPITGQQRLANAMSLDLALPLPEFKFSVGCETSVQELPSADELFLDGKILPLPIKNTSGGTSSISNPTATRLTIRSIMSQELDKKPSAKDATTSGGDINLSRSRSFWKFGRSNSVNAASSSAGRCKMGLVCPFPLSRSKSLGSHLNPIPRRRRCCGANEISTSSLLSQRESSNSNARNNYYANSSSKKNSSETMGSAATSRMSRERNQIDLLGYLLCTCMDKNMKNSLLSCSLSNDID